MCSYVINTMNFNREIYQELLTWKGKSRRKPLLLMGARQIGKTTILRSFGKQEYNDYVYLNLERQTSLHELFKTDKSPQRILKDLGLIHGKEILQHETLIILDEIQTCQDALTSLKYFQEDMPNVHVIGAGSLLGLTIDLDRSFPVGKVEFLDMNPLSFTEFLEAVDTTLLQAYFNYLEESHIGPLPQAIFESLEKTFREYLLIGGMPEVAAHYLTTKNISEAQQIQDDILRAYQLDFVKHADKSTSTNIQRVWESIPSQLGKENKKFLYKTIRSGARARDYEKALKWLDDAGILYKISRVEKPSIPLKAYEDISTFKLYVFETGLLMRLAGLNPQTFISGDQFFTEFKGSLAENYVAQSLTKVYKRSPYYWTSDGKAEIDYIIDHKGKNIPIEVKAGTATKAKSLAVYKTRYNPSLRIRISNLNLQLTDDLLNIPLFYSDRVNHLIDMSLEQNSR